MKKKLIAFLLAVSACFSLTSCDMVKDKLSGLPIIGGLIGGGDSTEDPAKTYDLQGAKKLLETRVKNDGFGNSNEDHELFSTLLYSGETYTIEWSVDVTENVEIVVEDDGTVWVDVNEALTEELPYALKAKITAPDGTSIETSVNRVVSAIERYVPAVITEAPQENVAYKLNAYSVGKKQDLYFAGTTTNYSYYLKTTADYNAGVDVYAEYVAGSTEEFYLYHNLEASDGATVKEYINIVKSGTHINAQLSSEPVALKFSTEYGTFYRNIDGEDCILSTDSSYGTLGGAAASEIGGDLSPACLVGQIDRNQVSAADKLAYEVSTLSIAPMYIGGGDNATIALHGTRFPDVKIAWASNNNVISFNKKTVSFAEVTETTEVTLTATLTIGEETETKQIAVKVVPNDAEAIIAAAASLQHNQAFGNNVTLTGVIVSIDDPYTTQYESVTFTMKVGDTRVEGYRMKGNGTEAKVIDAGYTVTCSGKFMMYNNKLEFSFGTIESYEVGEAPEAPEAPETAEEILNALYGLASNETLTGEFTLTGKITALDNYNNPTIVVEGFENMPVLCYKLKVENKIGDVITVTAKTMKNYNGTYEFMDCTLVSSEAGDGEEGGDVTLTTPEEILNALYALADGQALTGEFTLTGKITALDNYNNPTIVVEGFENMPVYCYKLKVTNAVGDVITVTAKSMKNYQNTYEFMDCTLVNSEAGEGEEGGDVTPPAGVVELEENVAYKFYMTQSNGINYYFTGETASGYKFLTSVYPTDAINVYAEKADAGYYFTVTVDGTKMYMGLVDDPASDYVNLQLVEQASATVFTYNADVTAWCATVGGVAKYVGTYNANTHIQNSDLSYLTDNPANIGKTQFPAQFMTVEEATKLDNDTERVAYEIENVTLTNAVEGARSISLMTAGKVYTRVAVEWAVTEGADVASISEGKLVITNPTAETVVKVVATIKSGEAFETKEFTVTVTPVVDDGQSKVIATFDFGANGSATHVDGSDYGTTKSWTDNGYSLNLTSMSKVYGTAYDATGNSCIKLGTSKLNGSFSFTVEDSVNKVVIYVAKYKSNASKVSVNGVETSLTKNSNDGQYDVIEVDTSTTKTVTFATVGSTYRAMINAIEFWS